MKTSQTQFPLTPHKEVVTDIIEICPYCSSKDRVFDFLQALPKQLQEGRVIGKRTADLESSKTSRLNRIALEMLTTLLDEVRKLGGDLRDVSGIATTLLGRTTDTSHLTVAEAARFCGVSQKTIRSRISAGRLTLWIIPGTRRAGIAVCELASGWIPAERARRLLRTKER